MWPGGCWLILLCDASLSRLLLLFFVMYSLCTWTHIFVTEVRFDEGTLASYNFGCIKSNNGCHILIQLSFRFCLILSY